VFICGNCIRVSPLARFVHHSTFTPNVRSHRLRTPSATGAGNWIQGVRWAAKLGARKSLKL
jgi:hypothetical protein